MRRIELSMWTNIRNIFLVTCCCMLFCAPVFGGVAGTAARETAEYILKVFGKGAAGQSVEEVSETTARAIARHGDEALPLLKSTGHAGFSALEEAGEKAPEVIKLYSRRGDEAIWVISEPKKLAIFIKHGDSAADALLKHPGIADNLIGKYGDEAVGAVNNISRQNAQRLNIVAQDGLLSATPRSPELVSVVKKYGDSAMEFIWNNKGALAVTSVLGTFLADPQAYFSGAKQLIVEPVVVPIVKNINWTFIFAGILVIMFLPFIVRSFLNARAETNRSEKSKTHEK